MEITHNIESVPLMPPDERAIPHLVQLCIGGVSMQFVGSRDFDIALDDEHDRFRVPPGASDIGIRVEWVPSISSVRGRKLFDSGTTWRLYEHEEGFRFDFGALVVQREPYKSLIVDGSFRWGSLQMSAKCFSAPPHKADPLGYPLDELLITHRLTQEKAIELHGCGIVSADGIGNLFVGHSEAGKSTTTRLWTVSQDVEVLSDDRIIVRRQDDQTPGQLLMYGTPWHGEAMFASPNSAPLTRIMVLEHGHGNKLTRLSPSQAVAELFARSFVPFHRHEYVDSALTFLEEVVASIPCYRYSFEPDQRAVDTILNLHD